MPQISAYPFVNVTIDTSGIRPVAQRQPGVICLVGTTALAGGGHAGSAEVNQVVACETLDDARSFFGTANGALARNPLYNALELVFMQDRRPSGIYAVRSAGDGAEDYGAALRASESATDITFEGLAGEFRADRLAKLREHVDSIPGNGLKRIAVAAISPSLAASDTYVADRVGDAGDYVSVKSVTGRMILIAARGAQVEDTSVAPPVLRDADPGAAAMGTIAAYPPHVSPLLKQVGGFRVAKTAQFRPSEIIALSKAGVIPVIDSALIPGDSLHLAEGATFTSHRELIYVDLVRVLDDVEFRLKAGLIGLVGDARITKAGLTLLRSQIDGILGPLKLQQMIDDYDIDIPLLPILSLPENARSNPERNSVKTARENRQVPLTVTIVYGPAIHRLELTLALKF